MSAGDFADFGRPQTAAKPGMVICLDCRQETAKEQSQFLPRENRYLCKGCATVRRRKFIAKVGVGVAVLTGAIVWMVINFTKGMQGR